ncbi:gamma-glutamylcyclotransferase family protein [Allohahella marinimesophila]|uniref:Gamma-glutamylcyclotransferase n=1 Tax=Allohahella marinimesophila TaxID=1054972 RepID=A0ABP7PIM0_9GAMM
MPEEDYLFVYGTLLKAGSPQAFELLSQHCERHASGRIQGKLFEVDGYPGMIDSDSVADRVIGELYQIGGLHSILPALDYYEECSEHFPQPHEYIRRRRRVILADHVVVEAWVYLYNRDTAGLERIYSGDYSAFICSPGES